MLAAEPLRYQALPHMMSAQWDCLELYHGIAGTRDYPQHFSLTKRGNHWRWINRPLSIDQPFVFGDNGEPACANRSISSCVRHKVISW